MMVSKNGLKTLAAPILVMVGLLAATGTGYGTVQYMYNPKILQMQNTLDTAKTELLELTSKTRRLQRELSQTSTLLSRLNSTVNGLQQDLSVAEAENVATKSKLSEAESNVGALTIQLSSQKSQYEQLKTDLDRLETFYKERVLNLQVQAASSLQDSKEQISTLQSQVTSLQSQITRLREVTVIQHYAWDYDGTRWPWELSIPLTTYLDYRNRPRPRVDYWAAMATDPGDDQLIDMMIAKFNESATAKRYTELGKVNLVIAFVQSLPYTSDKVTTLYDEYPRYPVETLFDRGGDCEDTSILVAALLHAMKYDVALLVLKDAKHMGVGIAMPGASGYYYSYAGKKYYYLETTGSGWKIGKMPEELIKRGTNAVVYPLSL